MITCHPVTQVRQSVAYETSPGQTSQGHRVTAGNPGPVDPEKLAFDLYQISNACEKRHAAIRHRPSAAMNHIIEAADEIARRSSSAVNRV